MGLNNKRLLLLNLRSAHLASSLCQWLPRSYDLTALDDRILFAIDFAETAAEIVALRALGDPSTGGRSVERGALELALEVLTKTPGLDLRVAATELMQHLSAEANVSEEEMPDETMRASAAEVMRRQQSDPQRQFQISAWRNLWFMKKSDVDKGEGILVDWRMDELFRIAEQWNWSVVAQKYVERPLAPDGRKMDLRVWMLILRWKPMQAWLCSDPYARLASKSFNFDLAGIKDPLVHLTNRCQQVKSESGDSSPRSPRTDDESHCWTLTRLRSWFSSAASCFGHDAWDVNVWPGLVALARHVLIAVRGIPGSTPRKGVRSFELVGLDIMLDEHLKPWLLEANCQPDTCSDAGPALRESVTRSLTVALALARRNRDGWVLPPDTEVAAASGGISLPGFDGWRLIMNEPSAEPIKDREPIDCAERALKEAIAQRNVEMLEFQIHQARCSQVHGDIIDEAEAVLKLEKPRAFWRKAIHAAIQSRNADLLDATIADAKASAADLPASEYKAAEDAIAQEAERERIKSELKAVVERTGDMHKRDVTDLNAAKEGLRIMIRSAKTLGVLESDLDYAEVRRRALHNMAENLKGSVRVYCRIRPLNEKEIFNNEADVTERVDDMTVQVKDQTFVFDNIFKPGTQEEVFEQCRDLVQSAADGYNVTLFAYGQTGAGKTYTTGGTPDDPGISRRMLHEIFKITAASADRCQYTILGSIIEILPRRVVDLMGAAKANGDRDKINKLNIRHQLSGEVKLDGLVEQECKNPEELSWIFESGMAVRKVMATSMNSESSRSHMIFCVKLVSINHETSERLQGKFSIVDLAGSERLDKSKVTRDGARDAIEINRSLTALGDVIEGLTKGAKQIPYRNNKLTELMKDALGGTAKTLMFVNCSPAASNAEETINALRWAARAKKITTDAKKNTSGAKRAK
jgi:hypothetical protein